MKQLVLGLALFVLSPSVQATLVFDFEFTNAADFGGGVITGEILGLNDNATGPASSVKVLSNSSGFGIGEYIGNPEYNVFTVVDGALTSADFLSHGSNNSSPDVVDSSFDIELLGSLIHIELWDTSFISERSGGTLPTEQVISRRVAAVVEPHMIALMGLGLAGIGYSKRRRDIAAKRR